MCSQSRVGEVVTERIRQHIGAKRLDEAAMHLVADRINDAGYTKSHDWEFHGSGLEKHGR
jgi:hypothetical protein